MFGAQTKPEKAIDLNSFSLGGSSSQGGGLFGSVATQPANPLLANPILAKPA